MGSHFTGSLFMPHGPFGYLLKNTAMLEGKWPSENVVIEIITWFGVIIFSFALLMFLKDVAYLTRAYFKLSRAFKRRKRNQHGCFKSMKQKICFCRARPDRSNGRIDQTKIVPSTRKPSRGRSLTSILYDDNIEASAVVQLNLSDAKRKASARLERDHGYDVQRALRLKNFDQLVQSTVRSWAERRRLDRAVPYYRGGKEEADQ